MTRFDAIGIGVKLCPFRSGGCLLPCLLLVLTGPGQDT